MFYNALRRRGLSLLPFVIIAAVATVTFLPTAFAAKQTGFYTPQQAQSGQQVFTQSCSKCHGAQLQGKAGPALQGRRFAATLKYSEMSAAQLFHFISTQMPNDHPGSLTHKQYLQVFAFILSRNGFPSGSKPLDTGAMGSIKLLPLPGGAKG